MSNQSKSPFYIVEELISPQQCELIVDALQFYEPDYDEDDNALVAERSNDELQRLIFDYVQLYIDDIQKYYGFDYKGMKPVKFSWYPEGYAGDTGFTCDNSIYQGNKWLRNAERDFTGVVFLSEYNDKIPFDSLYEVCGGKYEFPQHNFGFNANRGTMVLYPSEPHFLNRITPVEAGDLFMAKFHIAATKPWLYNPKEFPGTYVEWFETIG